MEQKHLVTKKIMSNQNDNTMWLEIHDSAHVAKHNTLSITYILNAIHNK